MAKNKSRAARFGEAVSTVQEANSEIESVKEELENWRDGLSGTNLENTEKFKQLETAIEGLDEIIDTLTNVCDDAMNIEIPTPYN